MSLYCVVTQSGKIYFVKAAESVLASNFITEVGHDQVLCCTEQKSDPPPGSSVFEI